MTTEGLFTEFMREERWLSNHLTGRPEVRRLLEKIRRGGSVEELDCTATDLEASLVALRPEYPRLGQLQKARVDEFGGDWRPVGEGRQISTTRFWVKMPITGDVEMLRHWPDKSEKPLKSVHHELMERIGGYANLAHSPDEDAKEFWRLHPTWQLHLVDRDDGPWALYTFVDLTAEEEAALARTGGLAHFLEERRVRVTEIVEEIAAQAGQYFEVELPAQARDLVESRRQTLEDRTELLKDLTLPEEWTADPLELEEILPGPPERSTRADDPSRAVTEPPAASAKVDLRGMSYRLSPKSFADVLRTIRTWADAVEQNPRGFGHLDEDAVSDLLAATLNATLPHADREVFSRSGRADIHMTANVLAEGAGPAKVFLCESKFADAQADVREALEEQLFRYLTARSTQAVLLALCRQQTFSTGENSVREWAATARGFTGSVEGPVDTWPHFNYKIEGRSVEVCIATVALPRVLTRRGRRK